MLTPSDKAFEAIMPPESAFMRASNAGVGVRLGGRTARFGGESVPVLAMSNEPLGVLTLDWLRSTDMACFLSGDRGESTVTTGAHFRVGEVEARESSPIVCAGCIGHVPSRNGVAGRGSVGVPIGGNKGDRPPMGDCGVVPVSFTRFSNLDRSEETGPIEDSSLAFPLPSIATITR